LDLSLGAIQATQELEQHPSALKEEISDDNHHRNIRNNRPHPR
jgi:hypothetical protein